jgi:hypothetical protein
MNINILGLISIHMVTLSLSNKRQRIARPIKALMGTLKRETIVGVTCWDLKFNLFKAFVASNFHI